MKHLKEVKKNSLIGKELDMISRRSKRSLVGMNGIGAEWMESIECVEEVWTRKGDEVKREGKRGGGGGSRMF